MAHKQWCSIACAMFLSCHPFCSFVLNWGFEQDKGQRLMPSIVVWGELHAPVFHASAHPGSRFVPGLEEHPGPSWGVTRTLHTPHGCSWICAGCEGIALGTAPLTWGQCDTLHMLPLAACSAGLAPSCS